MVGRGPPTLRTFPQVGLTLTAKAVPTRTNVTRGREIFVASLRGRRIRIRQQPAPGPWSTKLRSLVVDLVGSDAKIG